MSGLRELLAVTDRAGKELKKFTRDEIRKTAVPVRDDARRKLTGGAARSPSIARTAAGYSIYVRKTGIVSVEQRLRKTTGLHPEFGPYQMQHALIPALQEEAPEVKRLFEQAINAIAERFERT